MDRKPISIVPAGGGDMKRSSSELAFEEFFNHTIDTDVAGGGENRLDRVGKEGEVRGQRDGDGGDMRRSPSELAFEEFFNHTIVTDITAGNENRVDHGLGQELNNGLPNSQDLASKHHSVSVALDSQSSICVGSPNPATKPRGRDLQPMRITSSSSPDQSDEDDVETEAGPCEQSTDSIDAKRIKRMVSNRNSARRSRRRKQAHLTELEMQVEQLRGENASLFKQLTESTHQCKDATTNNRVLKSEVEALRANVKLAEDMVTRNPLTISLNHLLQNHLSTTQNMCRLGSVLPNISVLGDCDASHPGISVSGQNSSPGLENSANFSSSNVNNGLIGEAVSCVSEIWPWESHVPAMTK